MPVITEGIGSSMIGDTFTPPNKDFRASGENVVKPG